MGTRQNRCGRVASVRFQAALGFWPTFSNHLSFTRVPLALLVLLAKMDSTVSLVPLVPLVLEVALVIAVLLYVAHILCLMTLHPQEDLNSNKS